MTTLILAAASTAASPRVLTLDEALAIAHEHQPELLQAQANEAAAEARADQARSGLLPQITGSASYQRATSNFVPRPGAVPSQLSGSRPESSFDTFDYFSFGATATQLVYDFGRTSGEWQAAKAVAAAQGASRRSAEVQLAANVRAAFSLAQAQKALVAVAKEALQNQERHLDQVRAFVQIGTRPAIDLAQTRTNRANARLQLVTSENGYATAKAQLRRAIGMNEMSDFEVSDETPPAVPGEDAALEILLDEALAARPDLKSIEERVRGQELAVSAARGGYGPSLGVSTAFSDAGARIDDLGWNWNAAVTLSWPLFQGGLTRARVQEAEAVLGQLHAQRTAVEQRVRFEVEQARLGVRAEKAALDASQEALTNAGERLGLAEGRYATGAGSSLELSDAQLALTTAQAQRVRAAFNLAAARGQLRGALGRP